MKSPAVIVPTKGPSVTSRKKIELPSVRISENVTIHAPVSGPDWDVLRAVAEGALSPAVSNASIVHDFTKSASDGINVVAAVEILQVQIAAIVKGDMGQVEATLVAQAASLQSIYVNLSSRALAQQGLPQFQVYMGMALKAQAQCRTTLEALNEIKFPKSATFVKQANIASQQQVNNGVQPRVEKTCAPSNEQITEGNHAKMDISGTQDTGQPDPPLAAMEQIHGTKDEKRQRTERTKRA